MSGYAFRHALRYQTETWHGGRGRHREHAQFLEAKNAPQILKYGKKMQFNTILE